MCSIEVPPGIIAVRIGDDPALDLSKSYRKLMLENRGNS
jgi:hypothetical protein